MEVGLTVLPKIKIKSANRASKIKLSTGIKNIGKTSGVVLSNKKVFGKVITITKKNGVYEKKLIATTNQNLQNIRSKVSPVSIQKLTKAVTTGIKIYRTLEKQKSQAIVLSDAEFQSLIDNPKTIRIVIKKYTGNHHYFDEFFIRLALGNKEQVKGLLSIPYINRFIDKSIRQSGSTSNQFLMGQTFCKLLTDPKYGDYGQVLALIQIKLVRNLMKATLNDENMKSKPISQISSELDRLNDYLAIELSSCSDKEEFISMVQSIAKNNLSSSEYDDFEQMLKSM